MLAKYFTIHKRSHHFLITNVQGRAKEVIEGFAKQYIQFKFNRIGGRWVRQADRIWASRTHDSREYRFHINQYDKFIQHLRSVGLSENLYDVFDTPLYTPIDFVFPVKDKYQERDYQVPIVEYLSSDKTPIAKMLEIPTGSGKALPIDCLLKTPFGWIENKSVSVGDVLISRDGNETTVTGVYPQGFKQIYRITFIDGRYAECCDEHLWTGSYSQNEGGTYTLSQIMNDNRGLYIPLNNPTAQDEARLRTYLQEQQAFKIVLADIQAGESGFYLVSQTANTSVCAELIQLFQAGGFCARQVLPGMLKIDTDDLYKIECVFGQHAYRDHYLYRVLTIPGLAITDIQPDRVADTQCVRVDNEEHLFVVQQHIVTHNTFCALKACSNVGQRILAILKPTFIKKWCGDFTDVYEMAPEDVWCLDKKGDIKSGAEHLKDLLNTSINGHLESKVIILSSRTIQAWISDYNSMSPDVYELAGWPCRPDEMYEKLGIGIRVIDEAHQEFHLGFMIDLFTHVPRSISLSATMKNDDNYITQMYELVYPKKYRYDKVPIVKHVHSYAWKFKFQNKKYLRFSSGNGYYSHHEFENSIIRRPKMLQAYLDMILTVVKKYYMYDGEYRSGDRCLVYCASIKMCTLVCQHLKTYTNSQQSKLRNLDIRRYVEDDPYSNLMQADVCVSTLGSAGTGHDISNLTTVVLTTAVSSTQSNIQGFGRLRKITDRKTKFIYFVCTDSDKHLHYHREKSQLLEHRALTQQDIDNMSFLQS